MWLFPPQHQNCGCVLPSGFFCWQGQLSPTRMKMLRLSSQHLTYCSLSASRGLPADDKSPGLGQGGGVRKWTVWLAGSHAAVSRMSCLMSKACAAALRQSLAHCHHSKCTALWLGVSKHV
jgi:hypothetical protein